MTLLMVVVVVAHGRVQKGERKEGISESEANVNLLATAAAAASVVAGCEMYGHATLLLTSYFSPVFYAAVVFLAPWRRSSSSIIF